MSIFDFVPRVEMPESDDPFLIVLAVLYNSPDGEGVQNVKQVISGFPYDVAFSVTQVFQKVAKELNPPKSRKPRATEPKTKGAKK